MSGAHYLPAVGGVRQPLLRDRRSESVAGELFEGAVLSLAGILFALWRDGTTFDPVRVGQRAPVGAAA